jgi:MFS family permease
VKNKFQIQIAFATAFSVLTGGVFLTGLASMMGAGDTLLSYMMVLMNACGAAIIFFAPFMERFKSRKKVTLFLTALSKTVTVLIVLIPITVPQQMQVFVFVPLIVIAFSLQAQTLVSLNNWLIHFVEEETRGRYIALRMTVQFIVSVALAIIGGRFVDAMKAQGYLYIAFAILFGIAFILALFEIITLLKIDDVQVSQDVTKKYTVKDLFTIPLQNKAFRDFVIYMSLFYFLVYISASFNIVYMLKYLGLSYTEITLIEQLCMSLPMIFLFFLWGKLSDKKGHAFTLYACLWFFAFEALFKMLPSQENARILLPISFFFGAIANAGFNVSIFNRRYELIPNEGRIIHDNFFSAAIGITLLLGPIAGGKLKDLIEMSGIVAGIPFGEFRALYGVSVVGIILLQLFNLRNIRHLPSVGKKEML